MLKSFLQAVGFLTVGSLATTAAFNCSSAPQRERSAATASVEQVFMPSAAFAAMSGEGASIADIAENTVASVVNISTEKVVKRTQGRTPFEDPFFRQFFGDRFRQAPPERRERSLGSGVVVSDDGVILTNNHVVEGASEITVTLSDGRELEAKTLGTDPESDVGVLKLKEVPEDLKPLRFGNADSLRLGDIVLAVGNPFGVGQTVTMGIVSAKGRANVGIVDYEDFIQTDAAINPGNSGGALVNTRGELVGINTAILSRSGGYQGIGFAIPSNMARTIMRSLIDKGRVSRGFLGISIQNVDANLSEALGLEPNTRGVLVGGVSEDSPAQDGGMKRGDVIVSVDGEAVGSTGELRNTVALAGAENTVEIEVIRDGKKKTLSIRLGARPGDGETVAQGDGQSDAQNEAEAAGVRVTTLDDRLRERFRLPADVEGVVVVEVERGSRAARAGLRPGDVIREVNRSAVTTPNALREALASKKKGAVSVLVQRGELTQFLALPGAE
ncbi:MAG: DegQ family serine endoprotease [Myxococcota bacterium]